MTARSKLSFLFAEGFAASITAKTLIAFAVCSYLNSLDLAVVTRHFEPCLSFGDWLTMALLDGRCEQSRWFSVGPAGCLRNWRGFIISAFAVSSLI